MGWMKLKILLHLLLLLEIQALFLAVGSLSDASPAVDQTQNLSPGGIQTVPDEFTADQIRCQGRRRHLKGGGGGARGFGARGGGARRGDARGGSHGGSGGSPKNRGGNGGGRLVSSRVPSTVVPGRGAVIAGSHRSGAGYTIKHCRFGGLLGLVIVACLAFSY